jgi:hypothetical protein
MEGNQDVQLIGGYPCSGLKSAQLRKIIYARTQDESQSGND